jgi:CubicO group peptidase (beta-lactamase class C family)
MKLIIFFLLVSSHFVHARFTANDLAKLVAQSEYRDSDALMVWQNGVLVHQFDRNPEQLYSIQSITKSLTSLTLACLAKNNPQLYEAKNLFSEWKATPKTEIRMLLQMTSGIQDPIDFWKHNEYYDYSATLPLVTTPGWVFAYANSSTMLLGRWILETTGKTLSAHMKTCFFDPMGIKEWKISKDADGNEVASGGLYLKASDLLKIGIMLAQSGMYENQIYLYRNQVLDLRTDPLRDGNGYGMGFWTWGKKVYYGEGFLGQFLVIAPREGLVVLRLRNPPGMQWSMENDLNWMHEMPWFLENLL